MSKDFFNYPNATYRVLSSEEAEVWQAAQTVRKRAPTTTGIMRSLEVGDSHLFELYLYPAQLSARIQRISLEHGRTFKAARVAGEGVRVTRVT